MAFNLDYLGRVSTSGNTQALKAWTYNGTSTGTNEAVATIVASGYFNDAQQNLTSGYESGLFQVGDVIFVHGNDASGMYTVSSITTNVTVGSFAAIGTVDTANIADGAVTTAKLDADAVTAAKLADDAVVTANIVDANVTSAKLAEDTIQTVTVTLSTAEVLALATTPIELVAAPGADKVVQFMGATLVLNYNSIAYTESGDNMVVKYENAAGVAVSDVIECTGFIDATADTLTSAVPVKDAIVAASGCVNKALVMDNAGSNFAAGNSPVDVIVAYKVVTAGL